jgi:hypothetical protein
MGRSEAMSGACVRRGNGRRLRGMKIRALSVLLAGMAVLQAAGAEPEPGKASEQTYRVRWMPGAEVVVDGRAGEKAWRKAAVEKRFGFPWKKARAPKTEFRALCDGTDLYFTFRVTDADVVVLERLRDEEDEVFEDRGEV